MRDEVREGPRMGRKRGRSGRQLSLTPREAELEGSEIGPGEQRRGIEAERRQGQAQSDTARPWRTPAQNSDFCHRGSPPIPL